MNDQLLDLLRFITAHALMGGMIICVFVFDPLMKPKKDEPTNERVIPYTHNGRDSILLHLPPNLPNNKDTQ